MHVFIIFCAERIKKQKRQSVCHTSFQTQIELIYFYVYCCSITKFRIHIHYIAVGEYKLLLPLLLTHEHNVDLLGCH